MNLYTKVYEMNTIFSVWRYTKRLRITYVTRGWLVVWDHAEIPPARYDCQGRDQHEACLSVVDKLRELAVS